ncbi:hypothetical protein Tco_0882545 [Tanacetum coccineum]
MASGGSDRDAEYTLSRLLQRGTVAEYKNEFEMLISRVTRKSESLLTTIYIFGLKPTLQRVLLWSNPTTLGEAFSLARITETRFEDERSITDIAKTNNQNVRVQVQDLEETIRHKPNKVEAFQTKSVEEVVVSGGEAFGVDEDESNRVISVLKDGGGEFDDRLDVINLDLSQDFVIRVLNSRDVSGGSLVGFFKWVYREKNCEVFSVTSRWESCGSERRKVVRKTSEDGRTSGSDRGITIWDPGIKSAF